MHLPLVPHPAAAPATPLKVWATVDYAGSIGKTATANLWFGIGAPVRRFTLPTSDDPGRRDELWTATCFEAFLMPDGDGAYREYNFAPSGDWQAYDFSGYRDHREPARIGNEPYIRLEDNLTWWALGASVAIEAGRQWRLGLSAILEERDGTKSYWALAHEDDEKPDFHDAACFTARLG
jgi:hypothetical protein